MRRHTSWCIIALACIAAISISLAVRPIAVSADTSSAPPASALFNGVELPYIGLGVVWIRADGFFIIEISDKHAVAFETDVGGLSLVEKDTLVGFYQATTEGDEVHRFPQQPIANAAMCSAAFHIVGYLELDYDDSTGVLEVHVEGAKQAFMSTLDFSKSRLIQPDEQKAQQIAPNTCQASCEHPSRGCSASKTCDPGYRCTCKARCGAESSTCTCSSCSRSGAEGVIVVPEIPQVVKP